VNFANKISVFRILSVPFFIASLHYAHELEYLRIVALGIFVLAVISDAVDGYIARRSKQQSRAGAILDPLADKLLLVSAFVYLSFAGEFPFWLVLIIITRDIVIVIGTVVIYMVKQNINIVPSRWGKLTTTFQMSAVIAALLELPYGPIFWFLAAAFTAISGFDYLRRGLAVLYAVDNPRNNT